MNGGDVIGLFEYSEVWVSLRMVKDSCGAKFYFSSFVMFGQFGNCMSRSSRFFCLSAALTVELINATLLQLILH
jgi:hypothetical protein